MKIEIWSDIQCPFCYIGKRHLEFALEKLNLPEKVQIEWKSFQLDPNIPAFDGNAPSVIAYLAERKGISVQQSEQMHAQVTEMAANAGLNYRFDKAIVANSFQAHVLIQFAKTQNKGGMAEEAFFKAYFEDGKNLADKNCLLEIANNIGINISEAEVALTSDEYAYMVNADIQEARQIGVQGVPFFVFNRKYAISGAQPVDMFLQTMEACMAE